MKVSMWFLCLLLAGCSMAQPTNIVELATPTPIATCSGVVMQQITYTVGTDGVGLASAGDQCYGFWIEEGMGMVLLTQFTAETIVSLELNGQPVELETFEHGRIGETGNYLLYVDVADNTSATQLTVVINSYTAD